MNRAEIDARMHRMNEATLRPRRMTPAETDAMVAALLESVKVWKVLHRGDGGSGG